MHGAAGRLCQQTPSNVMRIGCVANPACSLPRWQQLHVHTQSCRSLQSNIHQHTAARLRSRLNRQRSHVLRAYGPDSADSQTSSITAETTGSNMIRRELVLFLIQQVPVVF
jgi:hypothetical protein